MGTITLPKTWSAEILTASDLNASFVEVRDKFNTYAVLTDTAKTVTVTHTWERTQTFTPSSGVGINVTTGGISVTGTAALAAVTCTTVTASGAISGTTGTFSSSVAATAVAVSGDLTAGVNGKIYSAATSTYLGLGNAGTEAIRVTGSAVYPVTDGGRALGVTGTNRWSHVYASTSVTTEAGGKHIATDGTATLWAWCSSGQARIETAGGHAMSFGTNGSSRWLVTSGGFLLAQTDNTYDIGAAGAQRPRNVYIAGTIDVGGTSTLAAVTCTTLAPSGITTLSGSGSTYALDFTGAAGRLRLANGGSLTFVQNDGSTSVLSIDEASGSVRVPFDLFIGTGNNISGSAGDGAGFLVLPTMGSAPSGTPSSGAGEAPCVVDTSNLRLYIRVNGTWRYATLT